MAGFDFEQWLAQAPEPIRKAFSNLTHCQRTHSVQRELRDKCAKYYNDAVLIEIEAANSCNKAIDGLMAAITEHIGGST